MDLSRLNISGDWHNDTGTLEKFSRDMSAYRILPALVVEPQNEEDVRNTIQFTRNEGLSIVPRSGGSDLSGASIGPGIILNFKKHLNRLVVIGEETIVQPGMILANLVNQLNAHNLRNPGGRAQCRSFTLNLPPTGTGPRLCLPARNQTII